MCSINVKLVHAKMWCSTSMLNEFMLRGDIQRWFSASMLNEFILRGDVQHQC